MTAEQKAEELHNLIDNHYGSLQDTKNILIEFANFHAKAQLEAILKKAKIIDDLYSYTGNTGSEYPPDQIISEESIINAYPLTNIQ